LPLYFVKKGYYQRKRLIETIGLEDDEGKLELYIQYARLPYLDPLTLDGIRREILERAENARTEVLEQRDPEACFQMLKFEFCDNPILYINYSAESKALQLKARAPFPPVTPPGISARKRQIQIFKDYEDTLCSQAAAYLLKAGETMPFLDTMEISLIRMSPEPVEGLRLVFEETEAKTTAHRRFGQRDPNLPLISDKELRKREKEDAKQKKRARKVGGDAGQFMMSRRHPSDELFDGTLSHESVLISARVNRSDFLAMNRSKVNYTARSAMEQFELRLNADEDTTTFYPVEPLFQPQIPG
jgi:hypothetical protein